MYHNYPFQYPTLFDNNEEMFSTCITKGKKAEKQTRGGVVHGGMYHNAVVCVGRYFVMSEVT